MTVSLPTVEFGNYQETSYFFDGRCASCYCAQKRKEDVQGMVMSRVSSLLRVGLALPKYTHVLGHDNGHNFLSSSERPNGEFFQVSPKSTHEGQRKQRFKKEAADDHVYFNSIMHLSL